MKKPLIGVVPLWDESRDSLWMIPGYLDIISKAGGVPFILPMNLSQYGECRDILGLFDGFLLTGGQDVAPEIYSQKPIKECGECYSVRDKDERIIFEHALRRDIPVLGICRGIQFINAIQGGTLYQDLTVQRPHSVNHQMSAPYDRVWHRVDIVEGSSLDKLLGIKTLGVNSYHHQAIDTLGRDMEVMAIAEDGLVEAICMPQKRFVWALQWHPELNFNSCESSLRIVQEFIAHCL